MKKCFWQLVITLCVMFPTLSSAAETYKLSDFHAGDSLIRLQGKSAARSLAIPLSSLQKVSAASIHIQGVSSTALQARRSVLNVRFNNATIAQIPYTPEQPFINQTVSIPQSLWRKGFNDLTFQASQHYINACEDGTAPELWSEIDLYRSSLHIDTQQNTEDLVLKHLSGLFSPGIGALRDVTLAWVREDDIGVIEQVLPTVAQGLALRNAYQPLLINTAELAPPSYPPLPEGITWTETSKAAYHQSRFYLNDKQDVPVHVLVATKAALQPYISDATYNAISGAYIGFDSQPAVIIEDTLVAGKSQRLIISGTTLQEVLLAARSLAIMDDELNPDKAITIVEQSGLSTQQYRNTQVLQPQNIYTFAETGNYSSEFRSNGEFYKSVVLHFPADFYTPESATVHALLDFSYGAGMGRGSVMNVAVNGKIVHGLLLDNPNGQAFNRYRLDLPARLFKGGTNTLDFSIVMRRPQSLADCHEVKGSHLVFQLHSSSSIELPEAGKVAAQPDLALFADTTFPFTYATADAPATLYYTQPELLSAALTLAGKAAQTAKTLNPHLVVDATIPEVLSPFSLILATPTDLTEDLFNTYSSALSNVKKWSYQMQNTLQNSVQSTFKETQNALMTINANTLQHSTLGDMAVLIMQENPNSDVTGSVAIIAAESNTILTERISELVSLNLWGQLAGDFFVWSQAEKPDLVMRASPKYELGDPTSHWLEFRMWLTNNPLYWILAILLFVFLGSWLSYKALKSRNSDIESSW